MLDSKGDGFLGVTIGKQWPGPRVWEKMSPNYPHLTAWVKVCDLERKRPKGKELETKAIMETLLSRIKPISLLAEPQPKKAKLNIYKPSFSNY